MTREPQPVKNSALGYWLKCGLHRLREVFVYLCYYVIPSMRKRNRVVIFAQSRTGSTVLEDLLASTGHFTPHGELFMTSYNEVNDPQRFIGGLVKLFPFKGFLFHLKVYHLAKDRQHKVGPAGFVEYLHQNGFKIIFLRRANVVKQVLSSQIARERGQYHKLSDQQIETKVYVDCDAFIKRMHNRFQWSKEELEIISHYPYVEVEYGVDLEDSGTHQATLNKILDFLSLERRSIQTKYRKVNTMTMRQCIVNHDEFAERIKSQGWGDMLDESLA